MIDRTGSLATSCLVALALLAMSNTAHASQVAGTGIGRVIPSAQSLQTIPGGRPGTSPVQVSGAPKASAKAPASAASASKHKARAQ